MEEEKTGHAFHGTNAAHLNDYPAKKAKISYAPHVRHAAPKDQRKKVASRRLERRKLGWRRAGQTGGQGP